ncbi:uncharacterized protein G2W53_012694 [Senna tora]|uniref:Uncharacterized protein n=1 Tax=Senna tora TaxID=362788 RepID=A0A834WRX7_9FABA|nr:uncharacterized protein G2W53_012694 [Senna tora]
MAQHGSHHGTTPRSAVLCNTCGIAAHSEHQA